MEVMVGGKQKTEIVNKPGEKSGNEPKKIVKY